MMKLSERYLLRQAAGAFWLLDLEQPGIPYRQPIELNEVGADIWRLHVCQGMSIEATAQQMSEEYGVPAEVIHPDVQAFLRTLAGQGIDLAANGGDDA